MNIFFQASLFLSLFISFAKGVLTPNLKHSIITIDKMNGKQLKLIMSIY